MKNKSTIFLGLVILALVSYTIYKISAEKAAIEPGTVTKVAVHVDKIKKMTMRSYVIAYGSVEVDPGNNNTMPAGVRITAPSGGIISEVNCRQGQKVNKGETLFRLDSRIVDLAIEKAQQAVVFAEKNFERQNKLQKMEGTSDKLYLQAKLSLDDARTELANAKMQRSLLTVPAPFSGTIVELNVNTGQTVDMSYELAKLCDLDRLVVTTSIPSREISQLKLGQQVEIDTSMSNADSATLAQSVIGILNYIDPQVDAQTDTVLVRTTVPAGSGLLTGQFVKMRIVTEVRPDCLAVPRESVYTDHDGQSTISIVKSDVARQKIVKTGLSDGAFIQVEGQGLTEGATVVTLGSYALPKETKVEILTDTMEVNK